MFQQVTDRKGEEGGFVAPLKKKVKTEGQGKISTPVKVGQGGWTFRAASVQASSAVDIRSLS